MTHPFDRLPDHWQQWVIAWSKERSGGERDRLGLEDFNGCVKLRFPDDSHAVFEYAFYVVDEEREELAVFTEHCGYHVFPLSEDLHYAFNVWAKSPGDPLEDEDE